MVRLVVVLGSALIAVCALGIGSAPARAANVAVTGSGAAAKIVITFDGSATDEVVTIGNLLDDWSIGNVSGTTTIPMATSCNFEVTNGADGDVLAFAPNATITSARCSATPFGLDTSAFGGSQTLSVTTQLSSARANVVSLNGPIAVVGPTTLDLGTNAGSGVMLMGPVDGAGPLVIASKTASTLSAIGSTTPPTSVSITTTSGVSLLGNITTSGGLTISGPLSVGDDPVTLAGATASITGDVTGVPGGTRKLVVNAAGASSITGIISDGGSGAVMSVDKRGAGTLTLTGASTYTGGTTVTGGTLIANTSGALGSATGGSSVASGARLQFNGIGSNSEPITLAAGSTLAAAGGSVSSLSGAIILQNGAQTVDVASGATLVLGGGFDGQSNGRGTVTGTGPGQLTVGSAGIGVTHPLESFAFSASGRLRIGGSITATGAVTLNGTVETWTASSTVTGAPVSGTGTIDNGNGSSFSTLTLDSGTEPNTLSGAIGSGTGDASKLNLVLAGGSSHTLSATSGFIGSLTIQSGGLIVSGDLTHLSTTTIASGAAVSGAGTGRINSPVSFPSGSWGFGIGTGYPYLLTVGAVSSSTVAGAFNVLVENTTPGTGHTKVVSTGSVNISGLSVWSDGFDAPLGTVITPLSTASGITGTLTGYPEGSYYNYWRISYAANGGKDMTWTFVGMEPQPTAVSPSTSSTAGGGTLTISGGPLYDGTQVTVGGAPCANPTRVSITELTCTLPPHAAGAVDVVVTNAGRSATLAGAVTYAAPTATPAATPTTRALAIGTPRLVGTKFITTITAPSAGAIMQTAVTKKGRKVTTRCRVRQSVTTAADVTVTCALNARTRTALSQSSLRLTVTTTFTPTGGTATTRIAKVTAARAATGKRALPA